MDRFQSAIVWLITELPFKRAQKKGMAANPVAIPFDFARKNRMVAGFD